MNVLQSANANLFMDTECFFGGGTAVTLKFGEYRLSEDIDFLCASREGYSQLRQLAKKGNGLSDFFPLTSPARDCTVDRYGIRQYVNFEGNTIRIEIVSEGIVSKISGEIDPTFGVPTLNIESMVATKLCANADRWYDPGVASRDLIDLAAIINALGELPSKGWEMASDAYSKDVAESFDKAKAQLSDPVVRERCFDVLQINDEWRDKLNDALGLPPRESLIFNLD